MTPRTSHVVLALCAAARMMHAQPSHETAPLRFAVASVKASDPNATPGGLQYRPKNGSFEASRESLDKLIGFAYDVRSHQIAQGPKWLYDALFDIVAKADGPTPSGPEEARAFRLMMQSLLADRFKLVAHRETRQQQIYELTIDKAGHKLKESTAPNGSIRMGPNQLTGVAARLVLLVNQLSRILGTNVVDMTGLTERYDFAVKWEPDSEVAGDGAPIFTAVRENLGLRLQPARGPVEIVVIDGVEKPGEN